MRRAKEAAIYRSVAFIAPALLLPIVAAMSLAPELRDSLAVHAAPLLVFGGGALLGIATGRGRLVFGLMVLALTMAALINFGTRTTFYAVALLLPLNLGVIAWLGETRALSTRSASLIGVLLLQAAAVAVFEFLRPVDISGSLQQPLVDVDTAWLSLPQFAILAFAAMLGVQLARFARRRDPLPAAAMWALVASFLALDTAGSGRSADLHFAAAGIMLALGTVLDAPGVVHRDSVTGLPASLEFNKMARKLSGHRYVLACAAIDDFTAFRNEQGVEVGNRMLRLVASAFKRVGGNGRAFYLMRDHHFVVVFRHRSVESAKHQLEIVRRAIERAILDVRVAQRTKAGAKAPGAVVERTVAGTISVGIAEPHSRNADPFKVLRDAEDALRSAQVAGMNRIVIHTPAGAAASV